MIVSPALSLMLTLSAVLVPPDGCAVVAFAEGGRAFAACADPQTWFVYEPDLTHDGLWSLTREAPPELAALRTQSTEGPRVRSTQLDQCGSEWGEATRVSEGAGYLASW